jgi:hypothetical protein
MPKPDEILDRSTKFHYQVTWYSPDKGVWWWPGQSWKWSLDKSCFKHTALCDTAKGAQIVCETAACDGGTDIKVVRWSTVTIMTRAQEIDLRVLAAAVES